jgi:hypothetical protein
LDDGSTKRNEESFNRLNGITKFDKVGVVIIIFHNPNQSLYNMYYYYYYMQKE